MADQKLTALTAITNPASTDILYIVDDPGGTPASRKVETRYIIGTGDTGANIIMNSPGQIVTDGAEPQWWDDSTNATLTDEDAAGEGIADKTERLFKCVTTGNDEYGYQTLTFADQELLDAGTTVVSLSCWVYCATGSKASIGIYGANLGLQESSQAGAGAWELLVVENITLNAADASIQIRLIVDTDTAYFTMPMLNLGSRALAWHPRQHRFVPTTLTTQFDLNPTGDVAWSDTDCTANSDALAIGISGYLYCTEPDGTVASYMALCHDDALTGADSNMVTAAVEVVGRNWRRYFAWLSCNDSQVLRYTVAEQDADSDVRAVFFINGYWMWA